MQDLYVKIHEYLNMDEEISFEEFDDYYKTVIKQFSEVSDDLVEEDVWKALFIIENLMSNAESRAKESKAAKQKKYKKMADRSALWAQNFAGRLYKLGYTEEQLNERFEKMFQDYANIKA
ncbi:hypothetical protein DS745_15125 [Anaerobacillus alkaliphilus]|uniref:Uncharacterized protein n=1 Tax=Anaerobacillus alkaliphilus TaxID=1548597 RepID=A0A4Q0VTY0_9BACI|nr:hypothetical protein [Anaerobacillus alkaliphilus]RXI99544.1 hypothetical protein DS745_15125 [Anaerobacillus alkaliphilus]